MFNPPDPDGSECFVAFRQRDLDSFGEERADVVQTTHAEAIRCAVDTILVQEDEITIRKLVQLLAERVGKVDGKVL